MFRDQKRKLATWRNHGCYGKVGVGKLVNALLIGSSTKTVEVMTQEQGEKNYFNCFIFERNLFFFKRSTIKVGDKW